MRVEQLLIVVSVWCIVQPLVIVSDEEGKGAGGERKEKRRSEEGDQRRSEDGNSRSPNEGNKLRLEDRRSENLKAEGSAHTVASSSVPAAGVARKVDKQAKVKELDSEKKKDKAEKKEKRTSRIVAPSDSDDSNLPSVSPVSK